MTRIWRRLVPRRNQPNFFSMPCFEWLYVNLGDSTKTENGLWSTVFAVSVWWAWKWRCGNIFGDNKLWRDRVKFVKEYAMEVYSVEKTRARGMGASRQERLISWTPPLVGWMKLNTDGASHGNPGVATAGGALRNGDGHWCGGFALNIGRCSAPLAELWGIYYGLCIAWEKDIRRIEVEVDSLMVVGFLTSGIADTHPLSFLLHLCHSFLSKDWEVRITRVYREANHLADGLANYAFSLPLGLHIFDLIPPALLSVLHDDECGVAQPRLVHL